MKISHRFRKEVFARVAVTAGLVIATGAAILKAHDAKDRPGTQSAQLLRPHLLRTEWQQASGERLSAADTDDLYQDKCALCHNADRTGKTPTFPSLIGVGAKYTEAEITEQIRHGKGRMPAFPNLTEVEIKALIAYIKAPAQPATTSPAALKQAGALFLITS